MRVFGFFLAVNAARRFRRCLQACIGNTGVAVDANAVLANIVLSEVDVLVSIVELLKMVPIKGAGSLPSAQPFIGQIT